MRSPDWELGERFKRDSPCDKYMRQSESPLDFYSFEHDYGYVNLEINVLEDVVEKG